MENGILVKIVRKGGGNEFLYSGNYFIYGGESSDGTNVFLRVGLSWIWITFRVDGNVRLGKG